MEQDIKILEEFVKYYESEAISRKFRGTLSISVDEYDIDAIEHLIKAYKEQNDIIKTANIAIKDLQQKLENSIPVSLVEEKIEELNKKEKQELKGLKGQDRYFVKQMYQYKRNVLQELLEKRK